VYIRRVTAAHAHEDLHRLVDRLTPDQAREVRTHVLRLVEQEPDMRPETDRDTPRELSFIGLIHAEPDLAERSEEILREEFRHNP
jgi:hypothetical protein